MSNLTEHGVQSISEAFNPEASQDLSAFKQVRALLQRGSAEGVYPGAVLVLGSKGKVVCTECAGVKWIKFAAKDKDFIEGPQNLARLDTVFDIGTLTTALVTAPLILELCEAGRLDLGDRVTRYLPGFGVHGKSPVTVSHLLSHSSGLAPNQSFYEELVRAHGSNRMGILNSRGARDYVINSICRSSLRYEIGQKYVYTDAGYILLGHLVESLTGMSLEKVAMKAMFQPLSVKSTSFIDLSLAKQRNLVPSHKVIAPSEDCPWRKKILCGEVSDENAWAMGGVAGHAGLFSSAQDLYRLLVEIKDALLGKSSLLEAESAKMLLYGAGYEKAAEADFGFGWERASRENGLQSVMPGEFGRGFISSTGCVVWIDPEHDFEIVLMSNRLHPSRGNKKLKAFLPELFQTIFHEM